MHPLAAYPAEGGYSSPAALVKKHPVAAHVARAASAVAPCRFTTAWLSQNGNFAPFSGFLHIKDRHFLDFSVQVYVWPQVTQLFTYLLTHKLFSSCIALSAVLLTFVFQFSLFFFHVESQAAAAAYYVVNPISHIGRCRKCGKYVFLYAAYIPGERLWIDSNGENGN